MRNKKRIYTRQNLNDPNINHPLLKSNNRHTTSYEHVLQSGFVSNEIFFVWSCPNAMNTSMDMQLETMNEYGRIARYIYNFIVYKLINGLTPSCFNCQNIAPDNTYDFWQNCGGRQCVSSWEISTCNGTSDKVARKTTGVTIFLSLHLYNVATHCVQSVNCIVL